MRPPTPRPHCVRTFLSRKPAKGSREIAALSLLVLALFSAAYWHDWFGLSDKLAASREAIFDRGELWRLVTGNLVHADGSHLVANSLSFVVLAYLLVGYYGVGVFPGLALAMGVVTFAISTLTYPPRATLVGASGIVYWMAGFWLSLYLAIDRRFGVAGRLLRAVGVFLVVFVSASGSPETSHRTHYIGVALGVLCGLVYFLLKKEAIRSREVWELEVIRHDEPTYH